MILGELCIFWMYAHDRSHHQQQLAGRANLPVLAQRVPSTSSKIMRWYRVLLVASTLLAGSDAATKSVQAKMSALDSTASVSAAVVAKDTIRQRFLRMDTSTPDAAKTLSYSFRDIDAEGDDATGDSAFIDSEDRAGGGAMESLKSLKSLKALSRSMSRASKKFSDKISPALPMKTKLRVWSTTRNRFHLSRRSWG
ncbi:unnamed protein product [Phytophthora lilii]|uniref:RxLR effector protein n=1 Tax=Phytophthora lilii TaxID=2077276 RepID=A0A9W6XKB2_9STRA|nr:unnamed protein product [Phytophthora lilii]